MPLIIAYFFISIATSCLIYFLTPLYQTWYNLYLLLVFFVGAYILCAISLVLFLIISSFFLPKNKEISKPKGWVYTVMRWSTEAAFFFMRHDLEITGLERIPKGPVCFVYNHLAMFDPILIMIYLRKHNLVCLTKKENINIFVGGNYMIHAGYVPIDRSDDFQAAKGILKCIQYGKSGYSIAFAPEGTRNKTKEPLLPFHAGCFKIPLKAQLPIVVIGFKGNQTIFPYFFKFKKTHLKMNVLDVLQYEDFKDKNTFQISDYIQDKMMNFVSMDSAKTSTIKN